MPEKGAAVTSESGWDDRLAYDSQPYTKYTQRMHVDLNIWDIMTETTKLNHPKNTRRYLRERERLRLGKQVEKRPKPRNKTAKGILRVAQKQVQYSLAPPSLVIQA